MDWTNAKILDFKLDFTKHRFIHFYFINQIPNIVNDKLTDKFSYIYSAAPLQTPWCYILVFWAPLICHFFSSIVQYAFFQLCILALTKIGSTYHEHWA